MLLKQLGLDLSGQGRPVDDHFRGFRRSAVRSGPTFSQRACNRRGPGCRWSRPRCPLVHGSTRRPRAIRPGSSRSRTSRWQTRLRPIRMAPASHSHRGPPRYSLATGPAVARGRSARPGGRVLRQGRPRADTARVSPGQADQQERFRAPARRGHSLRGRRFRGPDAVATRGRRRAIHRRVRRGSSASGQPAADPQVSTVQGGNQIFDYEFRIGLRNYRSNPVKVQLWDRLPKPQGEAVAVNLVKTSAELSSDAPTTHGPDGQHVALGCRDSTGHGRRQDPVPNYEFRLEYARDLPQPRLGSGGLRELPSVEERSAVWAAWAAECDRSYSQG